MTEPTDIDPRFIKASEHAEAIRAAADALTNAIYRARSDGGYGAVIRIRNGLDMGEGRYVGNGEAIHITGSIVFDIGKAI